MAATAIRNLTSSPRSRERAVRRRRRARWRCRGHAQLERRARHAPDLRKCPDEELLQHARRPCRAGRGIAASDPDEVVVLAHHFWERRLAGDPAVVGRIMILDGRPFTVVGVLPASNRGLIGFGLTPEVYVPPIKNDGLFAMYGRLKPGMSTDQTRAAARILGQRLDGSTPKNTLKFATLNLAAIAGIAAYPRRVRDPGGHRVLLRDPRRDGARAAAGLCERGRPAPRARLHPSP